MVQCIPVNIRFLLTILKKNVLEIFFVGTKTRDSSKNYAVHCTSVLYVMRTKGKLLATVVISNNISQLTVKFNDITSAITSLILLAESMKF